MSILQYGFMQRAFLVGILLAVITPCIGISGRCCAGTDPGSESGSRCGSDVYCGSPWN